MENLQFVDYEEYIRVEDKDGKMLRVFTDVDRLEKEMLAVAPEDRELITSFTKAVRKFAKLKMPVEKAPQLYNLLDAVKMIFKFIPYVGAYRKFSRISGRECADQCKNPLLKRAFEFMFVPETMVLFSVFTLAWMHRRSAGYPIGGSLKLARLIEKRYLNLGGKISYKSKVKKIVTENDSARAILLENGRTHNADTVISAADGHYTIFEMLDGKYASKKIRDYYENYLTFPSYVQVSLGIAKRFENDSCLRIFPVEEPIRIGDSSQYEYLRVRIFNCDPTLSPEGKTLITMMFPTADYKYWQNLRNDDIEGYRSEKDRIGKEAIEALDKKLGGIKSNVDMVDVSTPATVMRYTNNWKGSFEGWILTPKIGMKQMAKVLTGLDNFYMAGQWVEPGGGLPAALMSGRNVTQIIRKRDRKKFVTAKH